jgi:two-component system cell cycle response regulator CpdR
MPPRLLLLVDDDPDILDVLDIACTNAGFAVVIARRGAHALPEINTDAAWVCAVITDIKLDQFGSDGWEIARRARELAMEMPVIYATGGNAQAWASKGVPNSVLITKPFAPAQLITAVAMLGLIEADRAAMVQPQTLGEIIIGPAQYLTWRRKACRTDS